MHNRCNSVLHCFKTFKVNVSRRFFENNWVFNISWDMENFVKDALEVVEVQILIYTQSFEQVLKRIAC